MGNGNRSLLDRMLLSLWVLTSLLVLLAVCWWSMSFNLFPDIKLSVPAHLSKDPFFMAHIKDWSLGNKLGFWIASKGWDSGPPPEFAYDFILFWHLALSSLVYLGIFLRIQAVARKHKAPLRLSDLIPSKTMKMLFFYPVLVVLVTLITPWDGTDVGAHRVFSLMIYPPLFCSMSLIALGSIGKWVPSLLIYTVCFLIALLSFIGPIDGGGGGISITLVITFGVVVWSLATLKPHMASIRLLSEVEKVAN